jgi:hypothetical protein
LSSLLSPPVPPPPDWFWPCQIIKSLCQPNKVNNLNFNLVGEGNVYKIYYLLILLCTNTELPAPNLGNKHTPIKHEIPITYKLTILTFHQLPNTPLHDQQPSKNGLHPMHKNTKIRYPFLR